MTALLSSNIYKQNVLSCSEDSNFILYYTPKTHQAVIQWADIVVKQLGIEIQLREQYNFQQLVPKNYKFQSQKYLKEFVGAFEANNLLKVQELAMRQLLTLDSCCIETIGLEVFRDYQPTELVAQLTTAKGQKHTSLLQLEIQELKLKLQQQQTTINCLNLSQKTDLSKLDRLTSENYLLRSQQLQSKVVTQSGAFLTEEKEAQTSNNENLEIEKLITENCGMDPETTPLNALQRFFTQIKKQCEASGMEIIPSKAQQQFLQLSVSNLDADRFQTQSAQIADHSQLVQNNRRAQLLETAFSNQKLFMQRYFTNPNNEKFTALFGHFASQLQVFAAEMGISQAEIEGMYLPDLVDEMRKRYQLEVELVQKQLQAIDREQDALKRTQVSNEASYANFVGQIQNECKMQVEQLERDRNEIIEERNLLEKKNLILKRELNRCISLLNQEFGYIIGSQQETFYQSFAGAVQQQKAMIPGKESEEPKAFSLKLLDLVNLNQTLSMELETQQSRYSELENSIAKQENNKINNQLNEQKLRDYEQIVINQRSQNLLLTNINKKAKSDIDEINIKNQVLNSENLLLKQENEVLNLNLAQFVKAKSQDAKLCEKIVFVNVVKQEIQSLKVQIASLQSSISLIDQPIIADQQLLLQKLQIVAKCDFPMNKIQKLIGKELLVNNIGTFTGIDLMQFVFDEIKNIIKKTFDVKIDDVTIYQLISYLKQHLMTKNEAANEVQGASSNQMEAIEKQFKTLFPEQQFNPNTCLTWMMEQFQSQLQELTELNNDYVEAINDVFQSISEETGLSQGDFNLQEYVNQILFEFRQVLQIQEGPLLSD